MLIPSTLSFAASTDVTDLAVKCSDNRMFAIYEADETVSYTASWTNSASAEKSFAVTVLDYFGNIVYSQNTTIASNVQSQVIKPTGLTLGHYRITVSVGTSSVTSAFSVVPQLETRRDSSETFFAFNSMMTHANGASINNGDNISEFMYTINLAGVHHVREMSLGKELMKNPVSNPTINNNHCNGKKNYDTMMKAYADAGIKVELMFQELYSSTDTLPNEWTDEDNNYISHKLDLVYQFTNKLVKEYPNIEILEIYNEPDYVSSANPSSDGADRYAAFAKAAALGAYDADPNVKISLCGFVGSKSYIRRVFRNDIADYADVLSYHVYKTWEPSYKDSLKDYPGNAKLWVSESQNFGLGDKQIHVNESGLRVPTDKNDDPTEMTYEQQKAQARFNITSAIKGVSIGEDRHYMFKHGYFPEGVNNFGSMTKDNQPYMVYSAVSALTNSIGNGKYLGSMNSMPSRAEGYVFKDGSDTVLCLWSKNDNTNLSLNINSEATLIDMMGNESTISTSNGKLNVKIGQDIVYIRLSGDIDSTLYTPSGFAEKPERTINIGEEQRIVLNQRFENSAEENVKKTGYYKLSSTKANSVILDVYNFNSEDKTVRLKTNVGGEWVVSSNDDLNSVTVPAMGKTTLNLTVSKDAAKDATFLQTLEISGYMDGKSISKSSVYITGDDESVDYTKLECATDASNWDADPTKYIINSAACDVSVSGDTVDFDYTFGSNNNSGFWCSPYLTISDSSVFKDAYGVIFGAKAMVTKGSLPEGTTEIPARIYLYEKSGESFVNAINIKVSESESDDFTQIIYTDDDFTMNDVSGVNNKIDWDDIVGIRYGTSVTMNMQDTTMGMKLQLKNLGILKSSEVSNVSAEFSSASIVGSKLTINFGNKALSVKDNKVYADIGSDTYVGTYSPTDNSITVDVGERKTISNVEIYYTDGNGVQKSMYISNIVSADNKITLIYNNGSIDLKNTTLFAYDVSYISGATASTPFVSTSQTPILALDEANTDGKLSFDIKPNYEGTFVVKLRRNGEDFINFLLEMQKDDCGDYTCKIISVSADADAAMLRSDDDCNAKVIFAAYNDGKLTDCVVNDCTISEGTQTISSKRALSLTADSMISVYVWNSDGITPLSEKFSKN